MVSTCRQVVWKNYLVVYGGYLETSKQVQYFDDVNVFDLETYSWERVYTHLPRPLPMHCLCSWRRRTRARMNGPQLAQDTKWSVSHCVLLCYFVAICVTFHYAAFGCCSTAYRRPCGCILTSVRLQAIIGDGAVVYGGTYRKTGGVSQGDSMTLLNDMWILQLTQSPMVWEQVLVHT